MVVVIINITIIDTDQWGGDWTDIPRDWQRRKWFDHQEGSSPGLQEVSFFTSKKSSIIIIFQKQRDGWPGGCWGLAGCFRQKRGRCLWFWLLPVARKHFLPSFFPRMDLSASRSSNLLLSGQTWSTCECNRSTLSLEIIFRRIKLPVGFGDVFKFPLKIRNKITYNV